MRIIDADELMEHVWRDKLDSRELIAKMIEKAPTIKEIPTRIPIDVFEKLISPEPRWIPVSERLPEINQRVLVTSYSRVCYAMMISADGNSGYPVFRLQDSLNERVICETTVHSEFTTSRITAWMPLPEPYKEG